MIGRIAQYFARRAESVALRMADADIRALSQHAARQGEVIQAQRREIAELKLKLDEKQPVGPVTLALMERRLFELQAENTRLRAEKRNMLKWARRTSDAQEINN